MLHTVEMTEILSSFLTKFREINFQSYFPKLIYQFKFQNDAFGNSFCLHLPFSATFRDFHSRCGDRGSLPHEVPNTQFGEEILILFFFSTNKISSELDHVDELGELFDEASEEDWIRYH